MGPGRRRGGEGRQGGRFAPERQSPSLLLLLVLPAFLLQQKQE